MIAAGNLKYRVTITPPTLTQRPAGSTLQTFDPANVFTVWAAVRQQSDAEQVRNGINTAETTYAIRIRWRGDVTDAAKLTYRGRTLDVLGVTEAGQSNREWLDIVAKEQRP